MRSGAKNINRVDITHPKKSPEADSGWVFCKATKAQSVIILHAPNWTVTWNYDNVRRLKSEGKSARCYFQGSPRQRCVIGKSSRSGGGIPRLSSPLKSAAWARRGETPVQEPGCCSLILTAFNHPLEGKAASKTLDEVTPAQHSSQVLDHERN